MITNNMISIIKFYISFQDTGDSKGKADTVHIPKTSSTGNVGSSAQASDQFLKSRSNPSSPPESVFVRLSPNRQRYSFRDEL